MKVWGFGFRVQGVAKPLFGEALGWGGGRDGWGYPGGSVERGPDAEHLTVIETRVGSSSGRRGVEHTVSR